MDEFEEYHSSKNNIEELSIIFNSKTNDIKTSVRMTPDNLSLGMSIVLGGLPLDTNTLMLYIEGIKDQIKYMRENNDT
jgi:hypothetical protein